LDGHRFRIGRRAFDGVLDHGLPGGAEGARGEGLAVGEDGSDYRFLLQDGRSLIVIVPGVLALAVLPEKLVPESAMRAGQHSYNEVLP